MLHHDRDVKTFYLVQDKTNLNTLCSLCEAGKPKEVLAQIRKCEFDSTTLKKKYFVYEASPIPIHPTRHPFGTACWKNNFPIVRLLLELGADPDADCCSTTYPKTPRQAFADAPQLLELFEGGKSWWKVEYPDGKRLELQSTLEQSLKDGEASEAAWLMTHGVRISSPNVLASEAFGKQPLPFKELVCCMGIPDNHLHDFHFWLEKNGCDTEIINILNDLLQNKDDEGREIMDKLLLSLDLIGMDKSVGLVNSPLPISVQVSLLKHFISAYDSSEQKPLIEKCIAALFNEMLCRCMEVYFLPDE